MRTQFCKHLGLLLLMTAGVVALPGCQQANAPAPGQTPITLNVAPAPQISWSGDVDDSVTVNIQGGKAWNDNVTGKGVANTVTTITTPLPSSAVTTRLSAQSGRGTIAVVQQPTQANNYTAAVRVVDNDNGASHYQFTLTW